MTGSVCPLCAGAEKKLYFQDRRNFWQCAECQLVFVLPEQYLSAANEKKIYDLHDNRIDDVGYRRFLSRLFDPLLPRLAPGAKGLDFGCGPGPALAAMFKERGFDVSVYDIFYAPDQTVFNQHYAFITATEVIEHLHQPGAVLAQLWSLLDDGGVLALMTKLVIDQQAFSRWHYKNDLTHVCFFSKPTFSWLAKRLNAKWQQLDSDVAFFIKNK